MVGIGAVDDVLERDEQRVTAEATYGAGTIARMIGKLSPEASNLLGFILDMSYADATIVTCDAWKRKCGGLPQNSFVTIRLNPKAVILSGSDRPRPSLILARVTEGVATPVSKEVQQTIFEIHKIQAVVDPYTNAELQWGALKATILGTYWDGDGDEEVRFGADIDSYVSAHFYEVFVPESSDLELLINSFVDSTKAMQLGRLRYTETETTRPREAVAVRVSPTDFVANRTALFGKTRSGKSNTIKQIADMMLRSGENVGQIIFDIGGEYAYSNSQDGTSIYSLHADRCLRYSLNPESHKAAGEFDLPRPLKVNFLEQVQVGHAIIASLWDTIHQARPNYFRPLLEMWEPCDEADLVERFPDQQTFGDKVRYLRAQAMYFAALAKAGFDMPSTLQVSLHLNQSIRRELAKSRILWGAANFKGRDGRQTRGSRSLFADEASAEAVSTGDSDEVLVDQEDQPSSDTEELSDTQRIDVAILIYRRLFEMTADKNLSHLFGTSKDSGKPYFEDIHMSLLRILGDTSVSGTQYLIPFRQYHALDGSHVTRDIVKLVDEGKTVIVDLSNSDEEVARYYSKLITTAVLKAQVDKFTRQAFGDHSVVFYFEEAHNLFERDDKNLRSVYNRLAKEGAKYRIGLVYATQSMTTLSPDLLKNTENLFIAHLNDDREIHELVRHFEFRDVGPDVQRTRTQGYVRMITLSHRFALPVQIEKFGPGNASKPVVPRP